jgi:hypothetical protein
MGLGLKALKGPEKPGSLKAQRARSASPSQPFAHGAFTLSALTKIEYDKFEAIGRNSPLSKSLFYSR